MAIIVIALVILFIVIVSVSCWLLFKLNADYTTRTKQTIDDVFATHSFDMDSMLIVSKKLIIALNKQFNRIAMIENYNPNIPDMYTYHEIQASTIKNIENTKLVIKINFKSDNIMNTLVIPSYIKNAKEFCHNLLSKILFRKLETMYQGFKFNYFATSDWECSYIWAYDSVRCAFAYLSSVDKQYSQVLNLRKELVSIDTNYNYIELPMMGEMRQLLIYEKNFVNKLFSNLYESIRTHITPYIQNEIFYDSYGDILYLSNGESTFQTIILEKIEDVFYRETRLQFTLKQSKDIINYITTKEFIENFEKFVIGYNLRQIANSFDYKTDKLVNVNTNTKFIIDTTRDRVVYCANLNKFYGFSYMTISFSNLESSEVIKNAAGCYVRIKTKDGEILDVTCLKSEVAYYVKAQIDCIVSTD